MNILVQIRNGLIRDYRSRGWKACVAWPDPRSGCLKSRWFSNSAPGLLVEVGSATFCVVLNTSEFPYFDVDQIQLWAVASKMDELYVYIDQKHRLRRMTAECLDELLVAGEYEDPTIFDRIITHLEECNRVLKETPTC